MARYLIPAFLIFIPASIASANDLRPDADFNGDGIVDGEDLLILHRQWHKSIPNYPTLTPTPTADPPRFSPTPTPTADPAVVTSTPTPTVTLEEIIIDLPGLPQNTVPLVMVRIPSGSFQMGSDDYWDWSFCWPCEQPVHTVEITDDLFIGKYEVTQAQWEAVTGSNPADSSGVGDDYPVYSVSWNDIRSATGFLAGLNAVTADQRPPGMVLALPSEAEWEYCSRAGTTSRYSFGDSVCSPGTCDACNLDAYAWWCGNSTAERTHPVGHKQPNPWGLHDMHGNVWEWCEDDWHDGYIGAPESGVPWIDSPRDLYRILRGGAWSSYANLCRSSSRTRDVPSFTSDKVGLRLVLVGSR